MENERGIEQNFSRYDIFGAMLLLKENGDKGKTTYGDITLANDRLKECARFTNEVIKKVQSQNTPIDNQQVNELEAKDGDMGVAIKNRESDFEKYMEELNSLIGLEKVKKDVSTMINLVRIRKQREEKGLPVTDMSLHLVFTGNPGTGKTTVARLISKIYQTIGVLEKGHLIETDRSGMIGQYIGHTEKKTERVIESAVGGVLFIDEAYALAGKGEKDYGNDAIEVLLKQMEDRRDQFIVIVAGYPDKMEEFLKSNPGLKSRFNKFIGFEDYSSDELHQILLKMCNDGQYEISEGAIERVKQLMKKLTENKGENFANGRAVRNIFEKTIANQANRLARKKDNTVEELSTLEVSDFNVEID